MCGCVCVCVGGWSPFITIRPASPADAMSCYIVIVLLSYVDDQRWFCDSITNIYSDPICRKVRFLK